MKKSCIAISGTDPTCGAGAQLDIQVLSHLGVMPLSVITAVTVQSADLFKSYWSVPPDVIKGQIETVVEMCNPQACKIGMLTNLAVETVINLVESGKLKCPIILDPILKSSSGFEFVDPGLLKNLFKKCFLVTPNIPEMESFLDMDILGIEDMEKAVVEFSKRHSCSRVLLKGGHLPEARGLDILYSEGSLRRIVSQKIIETGELHGTGCFLSSAIAGYLVLGNGLEDSIELAKSLLCIFMEKSDSGGKEVRKIFSFYKEKAND